MEQFIILFFGMRDYIFSSSYRLFPQFNWLGCYAGFIKEFEKENERLWQID
jgi:hypothetical protein